MSIQPPPLSPQVRTSADPESTLDWGACDWQFRSDLSSVSSMRHHLRSFLGDAALSDDEIEDLVLAASEAANNAVEHAQQPREPFFDVSVEFDDGAVTIVIRDHGHWLPQTTPSVRGRGLAMMHALTDTSVRTHARGTTVTIRNRRAAPGPMAAAG